ncbi:hypothetical protein ACN38_g7240, partial [Penicillium nordicum]
VIQKIHKIANLVSGGAYQQPERLLGAWHG